jgi:hypothetical protein
MDLTPENTQPEESFNLSSYRRSHASPHVEQVAYWIKAFERVPREYDNLETAAKNLLEELRPLTDVHTLDRKDIGITYDIKKCAIDLERSLKGLVYHIDEARECIKTGFYARVALDDSKPQPRDPRVDDSFARPRVLRACDEVSFRGKHFLAAASEV